MERLLAYEASAGTGKTFALVVRYISLLFLDAKPESILALTFTNKAANEMKSRIANRLKNLKDSEEIKYICENTSLSIEEILKKQPKIYKNFLDSDIKITTIDSFFTGILRKFSMQAGIAPDFSISSSEDREKLFHKFLYYAFSQKKEKELINISILQEKRLKDIFSLLEKLYKDMIDFDVEVNLKDFRKYEKEAKKSFFKIKEIIQNCPKASNSALKAVNKIEKIEDVLKETWFSKESLNDYSFFKKCFNEELDRYFFKLKASLNSYINIKEAIFLNSLNELYLLFKETNKIFKRESLKFTFDDVQNFVYYLLKERVDRDFLYFRLDSKIEHLLIDEFQDTSIVQYKLLEPFIEEIVSGEGQKKSRTFFYVGDIKQSIYRFRGGFKELFLYVANRFNIKLVPMNINYRSDKLIVEFVNEIFEPIYREIFGHFNIQKANSEEEGYVEVKISSDPLEEILNSVDMLINSGIKEDTIAILCFKNDEILQIEEFLKKRAKSLNIVTESSSKLINQKEIVGIIEFLKYIYFQEDILKENFSSVFCLNSIEIDTDKFLSYQNRVDLLVKKALKEFKIGMSENILRFIEILQRFDTLGDFIFEYEKIDEKVVSGEQKGLKILTIHKSKGLEFENVIVVDRLSKPKGDSSTILYDCNGIKCEKVFLKKKGREFLDIKYKKALEKEKKLQLEDLVNSLYVAFTRAKNSLIVIKKDKYSAFGPLNLKEKKEGKIKGKAVDIKELKTERKLDFIEKFYGLQNIKSSEEKKILTKEIIFGNALHYALEMLDFNNINSLNLAIISAKNRFGKFLDENEFEDIKKRVEKLLKNKRFNQFLKNSKIYKELPLSYKNEVKQIDLLIEKSLNNIVIDYKSSKDGIYEHKKQVRLYKEAVKNITKKETFGYICYLLEDKIELIEV